MLETKLGKTRGYRMQGAIWRTKSIRHVATNGPRRDLYAVPDTLENFYLTLTCGMPGRTAGLFIIPPPEVRAPCTNSNVACFFCVQFFVVT